MAKFTFNIGGLHFEQVTIDELYKIFSQEAEIVGSTQSIAKVQI
ncbi:hypothetical protein [Lactiplantibacillus plantarum]|nr:hypothetical protein [Lactiplantibacillus plantarum]ALC08656.1 hypothetical protein JM48_1448 [Lactiplantibacillus plantarum]MDB7774396.1 hypothetical protein [Lactiplantibacillus plantarum]MDP5371058.1 hypothetical protein [Lactiplantibacillus plantarum]UVW04671.1 hypothetical protein NX849_08110 [Lactiplantibacillus plantarum]UWF34843.1 hypothetical protein NYR24_08100 [Lactiplantibacillus plantarum]